ncbi:alginate lyase family protein [uncultured Nitrospira sp.]|uniref:heparinase II/III family protein n=1 Tax=uncultured Nitrospira sp. TaxID=157176 RepID=UPI0031409B79
MNRLLLYARTLSHLKASQLVYLYLRRGLPRISRQHRPTEVFRRQKIGIQKSLPLTQSSGGDYRFVFLNQSMEFSKGQIDWVCKDMPKLWRYNLHYFDFLQDPHRSTEGRSLVISDWIEHNPLGTQDAWEPYAASLRIVNWVKFFLSLSIVPVEKGGGGDGHVPDPLSEVLNAEWLKSLYLQALWLEQNIEFHFLANHYLKNGVALFFAGMFFEGRDAERWLKKGLKILCEELEEQFLADGAHFERSPMYHSISVVDFVDVLNLMRSSNQAMVFAEMDHMRAKTVQALNFLHDICLPDGDIPLFNDSAFGIAPSPSRIFDYAKQAIGYEPPAYPMDLSTYAKSASGYYVIRKGGDMMVIDCGPIGPDYNPAHAHCDTLSYELSLNGRRVIVDSGVYDYEPSLQRAYARSTKAHNTVVVDGQEQSEMWGVFRVARRAKPLFARLTNPGDGHVKFEGAHDGYRRFSGQVIHERSVEFDGFSTWIVKDDIQGNGTHSLESYVHLHPDCTFTQTGQRILVSDQRGLPLFCLEIVGPGESRVEEGWYFPEFGVERKKHVVVFTRTGPLPLSLSYRITKASESS